jgi:hypothetical protein
MKANPTPMKRFSRMALTYRFFMILILLSAFQFRTLMSAPTQDFLIYLDGDEVKVEGRFDRVEHFSSKDASEAIQFALDEIAESGGDVILGSGRFFLDRPLKISTNCSLRGSGRSTKLMVSEDNEEGVGIMCWYANGVEISDLCLSSGDNEKAKTGLIIDRCGDVKVFNIFSVGFAEYGLWLRNQSFLCEVSSCTFAGNMKSNVYLDSLNWGIYGNFIPNLLADCTIYGGGKGIECNYVIVLNIVACNIYQTNDYGIHLYKTSNSVLINGCRTFQISSHAVVVENTHELNITGNIFCWSLGDGIVVEQGAWGTICGNNVIDNGSFNPGGVNFESHFEDVKEEMPLQNGITLKEVRGFNVSNNTIFNWNLAPKMRYGIYEDSQSYKNVIEGNNINYYMDAAVLSEGAETIVSNNVELDDVTFVEVRDYAKRHSYEGHFRPGRIQSYQPELTEEFIESLK